jgi:hypothetical protein
LSSSILKSAKALAAESRSPGTTPRAMSCSLYTTEWIMVSLEFLLEHDLGYKSKESLGYFHSWLESLQLIELLALDSGRRGLI